MLYLIAFLASFCSLSYELIIAKTIGDLAGNYILWKSITIGIFILATGIGLLKTNKKSLNLFYTELLLSIFGVLSILIIYLLHTYYKSNLYIYRYLEIESTIDPLIFFAFLCQFSSITIGLLSGIELKKILSLNKFQNTQVYILLYFFYYLGNFTASIFFILFLKKNLSEIEAILFISTVNLLIAVLAYSYKKKSNTYFIYIAIPMLLVIVTTKYSNLINQLQLKNTYYNNIHWSFNKEGNLLLQPQKKGMQLITELQLLPNIKQIKSLYQTIDIVFSKKFHLFYKRNRHLYNYDFKLYLNRHFQFDTSYEKDYHAHLAHVPMIVSKQKSRKTLILGAGDGLLTREILKYPYINEITLIELDSNMITLAKRSPLKEINQNSLFNPKVKIIIADAFQWIRTNKDYYDAIYIDFPFPYSFDLLRMYSYEFFLMIYQRVSEKGFVSFDVPYDFNNSKDPSYQYIVNTLSKVGFKTILIFRAKLDSFIMTTKTHISENLNIHQPTHISSLNENYFNNADNFQLIMSSATNKSVNTIFRPKKIILNDKSF
jgi:spermidine synthase